MATTFLELIVMLLWPLVLLAVAWVIAVNALTEKDEISQVVGALIRPDSAEANAKRADVSPRRSNSRTIASGDRRWFQVHFRPTRATTHNTAATISRAKG